MTSYSLILTSDDVSGEISVSLEGPELPADAPSSMSLLYAAAVLRLMNRGVIKDEVDAMIKEVEDGKHGQ